VFGVGPQELLVVVLLLLVVFGPGKAAGVARDLGRFASEARCQVKDFKSELALSGEDREEGDRQRRREPRTRGRVGAALAGGIRLEGRSGSEREGPRGPRPSSWAFDQEFWQKIGGT
jgi:Sec-independent protein translocase protein TatA